MQNPFSLNKLINYSLKDCSDLCMCCVSFASRCSIMTCPNIRKLWHAITLGGALFVLVSIVLTSSKASSLSNYLVKVIFNTPGIRSMLRDI